MLERSRVFLYPGLRPFHLVWLSPHVFIVSSIMAGTRRMPRIQVGRMMEDTFIAAGSRFTTPDLFLLRVHKS